MVWEKDYKLKTIMLSRKLWNLISKAAQTAAITLKQKKKLTRQTKRSLDHLKFISRTEPTAQGFLSVQRMTLAAALSNTTRSGMETAAILKSIAKTCCLARGMSDISQSKSEW